MYLKLAAHYIYLDKGQKLLMVNGYSFSKSLTTKRGIIRYVCSSKGKRCKAYVHVTPNDVIIKQEDYHCHEPVRYKRLANGRYFRIGTQFIS